MEKLIIGLPKGSLQEATYTLFKKAGFNISGGNRSYFPSVDDEELDIRLLRPQEMSRYVENGMLDAGIAGLDWIQENGSDVIDLCDLVYSKRTKKPVRWVLAVPNDSPIKSIKDLEGKRIATEGVGIVQKWLNEKNINANIEFSWGATEVKVPDFVDAIVDVTETGSSLRSNNLRIIDTIMESYTKFFCSKEAWGNKWKNKKLKNIKLLLQAAYDAEDKVLLKLNINKEKLDQVLQVLPALNSPTINQLTNDDWYAIETVIDEPVVRTIIPSLKEAGAEGIIEISLNKIVD